MMGVILVAILAVYARSVHAPLLFDDRPAIERNESIRHLWPLTSALRPPVTAAGAAGRPIVNLSLAVDYALGGLNPEIYHWTNLALHGVTALMLAAVLRRTFSRIDLLRSAAGRLAALIALLWAVHPLATEAVVCVVQRNEILASLFLLLTFYAFIRATEPGAAARRWQGFAVGCCVLGMASKETMAGAPLLLLLYDRTFVAGGFRAAWRARRWFYAWLASTWLLLAFLVGAHEQRAGTVGFGLGTTAWDYLVTQAGALALYLKLSFWPHPLVLDYGFEISPLGAVWSQALLIVALVAATGWALRRSPRAGFLGTVFFTVLAPSSSFLPLTTQTLAEHRMYLPLAMVLAAAVIAAHRIVTHGRTWLCGGILVASGALTVARVETYRDEGRLWRDTIAEKPGNARAHASLAAVLVGEEKWPEALTHYERALALRPDYADAQNDCANVLLHLGRPAEALAHYEAAARLKPDDDAIRFNLAAILGQVGKPEAAISLFEAILARDPRNIPAANALGDARLKTGQTAAALAAFEAAVAIDPASAAAQNNAGIALVRLGRFAEAVAHYEVAARLLPDLAQVHHNLALALDGAGRQVEAMAQEETALRLDASFGAARAHLDQLRARGSGRQP